MAAARKGRRRGHFARRGQARGLHKDIKRERITQNRSSRGFYADYAVKEIDGVHALTSPHLHYAP